METKKIAAIVAVIIIIVAAAAAYVSLGGSGGNDDSSAHPLILDQVYPSEDNVLNGTYEIQRNLVLVTLGEPEGNVAAFLDWITSDAGQEILADEFVPLPEDQRTTYEAPSESGQTTITLSGSTSLTETMLALVEEYMNLYPYMTLTVGTGGSGVGEQQAAEGVVDIGMLSRDLSQEGADNGLIAHNIGKDGVAVIANIDGVKYITMEQVAAIFSGEITNWSQVGGPDQEIAVVIREDGSGTRECFENAMKTVDSDWSVKTEATSYNSTGGVISQVQSLYGSIGYISLGQVKNLGSEPQAHALVLNDVVPTEDNVLNGTYDIQRNLVLVTLGEPEGNVAAFLDWITSDEGQEILADEFVPIPEDQRTTYEAPSESGQTTIALSGSTSLTETMLALAEEYMQKYPYMTITVGTGGSGVGEQQAAEGVVDIGMLSRDLSQEGADNGLIAHNIGKDGVAVIANIDGLGSLTLEQVAAIFSGEITNWSQVGGPDQEIAVVIREDGSGTRECFENAMDTVDPNWTVKIDATSYNSTGGVISQVQSLYGSIGYISLGQVQNL